LANVFWTKSATADLDQLETYIAADSEYHARRFVERVERAVGRLALFPESGRMVPDTKNDRRREIMIGNYRVLYRIQGEQVWVLGVRHDARKLPISFN
jgi:plasmid stabilization system protein ParE